MARGVTGALGALALVGFVSACGDDGATEPPPVTGLVLTPVATVSSPIHLTSPPNDARLFIVERGGRIRVVKDGSLLADPFLDISAAVSTDGEQGLLSVAFHPSFASNGLFYIYFSNVAGDIRVVRYRADPVAAVADGSPGDTILRIAHPTYTTHYGGLLSFGPDGKLYISVGDGGGGGDPHGNAQNRSVLLGKLLRIDVDAGFPYAIPDDNPFAHESGARGEIWEYGLRNPWRYAFDDETDLLFIGDVGQNTYEELDAVPAAEGGDNFGWDLMEGAHCFGASTCSQEGLIQPIYEYSHDDGAHGCAIIGGYVYRGARMPSLHGQYFFSDYCAGFLRSFSYAPLSNSVLATSWDVGPIGAVQSIGQDASGELYVLAANGTVYRIDPAS